MLIECPPEWFRHLFPGAVFRIPASDATQKRVFLTFDDGPVPEVTPWVLDQLDRFGVKATFFMVGQNVQRYPHLAEEVKKRGHEMANHSLHHIRGLGISPDEYLEDVNEGEKLTGSILFRPPHGWLSPRQMKKVKGRHHVIMYDLVTRDYSRKLSAENVVENVRKLCRDGSIIVFHDSIKSWDRLKEALPESLSWLLEQGYRFELIGEALNNRKEK